MTKVQQGVSFAAFLAVLGITLTVYWPGLDGPLILDDIPNLGRLKHIGPVNTLPDFLRFIFSSSDSYPLRPLAFASFLVNDIDWPLYVPAHKYTNVLIHLINGALVFWLSLLLCQITNRGPRETAFVALTATTLWLLAPLQVSTVLYVIQRMTSLSALFVLCGLITYCYGRRRLDDRPLGAFTIMTSGVVFFGALGFLCKQNALLLTLYILATEHALIKPHLPVQNPGTRRYFAAWQWLVLAAPVALVFIVLIARGALNAYAYRPFTAFERIASQPRILFEYLQDLLIPVRQGMGVAHDDYVLSTGLLSPPTTIIAIAALLAATVAALWMIRRAPTLFGFAVLWFVSGHVLESSIIALEPYFEHRNYLPAFGPLFALSYFVWTTRIQLARYMQIGLAVYLACFIVISRQNVDIWSDKILIGEVWAQDHPDSLRAQQFRAKVWSETGHREKAHEILKAMVDSRPDAMASQLQILLSACRAEPEKVDQYLEKTLSGVQSAQFDHASVPTLIALNDARARQCPDLSARELLQLIDTILDQESVSTRSKAVSDLLYVQAVILAGEGKLQNAVAHLYAAFNQRPSYDLGLAAVRYLYDLGEYRQALRALEDVESIELQPWDPDNFRSSEINHWRSKIQSRIESGTR